MIKQRNKSTSLACAPCGRATRHRLGPHGQATCIRCHQVQSLFKAKEKIRRDRRASRIAKQKAMGTYVAPERKKRERQAKRRELDPQYVHWIHSHACCVPNCSRPWPVVAHHADHRSQLGSDRSCVPLCNEHHTEYHGALGSKIAALKHWGVDFKVVMARLNFEYVNGQDGPFFSRLKPFNPDAYYSGA